MAWTKEEMCRLTATTELKDNFYVNLGIGMPTEVANYIDGKLKVTLQSENGMLGMGPFPLQGKEDADLINAGKQTITKLPYSSFFDSATSFAMIRGGHIDLSILGALEVSEQGDLANWMIPNKMIKGMGGAMDLVAGVKRIVVLMEHTTKDKQAKIVKACKFPLTGQQVVHRIITELGIFDFEPEGLVLKKIAPLVSLDQIRSCTEADFIISH